MFWNYMWGGIIVLLIASGLFDKVAWSLNVWLILAVFIIWLISLYNSLIRLRNQAEEGWSDIDVQLKRRYDLIPNLVQTVKGYAKHEEGVFTKVTEARTLAMSATGAEAKGQAENMLSGALKSLFAVAENYPELKANANFLDLQRELADTENKIQASRRFYNGTVRDLNTKIETFPTRLVAGMFGFSHMDFFKLDDESEKEPVKVSF